jgi:hypothetical protein
MSADIFISYRRDDAKSEARSIYERMVRKFGSRRVFMDVEAIQHGADFPSVLNERLSRAKVLLVVIGPYWASGKDSNGTNRLDNPADFVRLEVISAIDRGIMVIPLLVGGAKMPAVSELPQPLQPLLSKNAAIITHENFASDIERVEQLLVLMGKRFRFAVRAASLLFGLLCVSAITYWLSNRAEQKSAPPSRRLVSIGDFSVEPQNDQDLVWLKIKVERNFVDYLIARGVHVTHRSSALSNQGEVAKEIVGAVERNSGGNVEIRVQLLNRKEVLATTSYAAPFEIWQEHYKSIPELMIFSLGVIPETLTKRETAKRPTESLMAALLYFEAARFARNHQLDRASALLDKAIAEDRAFATAFWAKGQVLYALGNKADGEEWEKKADAMAPDHARPKFTGEVVNPLPSLMTQLQTSNWSALPNHVLFKEVTVPSYGIEIKAWSFSPAEHRLDVVASNDDTGSTAQQIRLASGAILAINGGFFDIDQNSRLTPSGLLISRGRKISATSDRRKGGSGVIYEKAGAVAIDFIEKFEMDNSVTAAVQVGPLVVDPGGKNGIRRNDHERQNRSAICKDQHGRITIVVVTGGLSLFELGEVLSARESDGGFACERALNLDGGPSTQVSFSLGGKNVDVVGRWKIASAILLSAR